MDTGDIAATKVSIVSVPGGHIEKEKISKTNKIATDQGWRNCFYRTITKGDIPFYMGEKLLKIEGWKEAKYESTKTAKSPRQQSYTNFGNYM